MRSQHMIAATLAAGFVAAGAHANLLVDTTVANGGVDVTAQLGTPLQFQAGTTDDKYLGSRGIGFTFQFFTSSYISIYPGANGELRFTAPFGDSPFINTPIASSSDARIAAYWDDLDPDLADGFIIEEQKSLSGIYAMTWRNTQVRAGGGSSGPNLSYQTALFGTAQTLAGFDFLPGDIALSYADITFPAFGDVTIGLSKGGFPNITVPLPGDADGVLSYSSAANKALIPQGDAFILFRRNLNNSYDASIQSFVVPEPTSIAMLGLAAGGLLRRRRA